LLGKALSRTHDLVPGTGSVQSGEAILRQGPCTIRTIGAELRAAARLRRI